MKKTPTKTRKKIRRRQPYEPDLAKAAVQFYREQAYTYLVKHGGPPGAIAHAVVGLVRGGCPIRTASLIVDWVVVHSFGNTVLH